MEISGRIQLMEHQLLHSKKMTSEKSDVINKLYLSKKSKCYSENGLKSKTK